MSIETGLNWKIYVDTSEDPDPVGGSPTWVDLPQQRELSLEWSGSNQEANHKDNAGWADAITTSRSLGLSGGGFADPNDAGYLYLVDTVGFGATTDHPVGMKLENADGDTYIGFFAVDNIGLSAGFDEVVNYTMSATSRGAPTVTRA